MAGEEMLYILCINMNRILGLPTLRGTPERWTVGVADKGMYLRVSVYHFAGEEMYIRMCGYGFAGEEMYTRTLDMGLHASRCYIGM
jgi:hypothetical protein